MVGGGAGREVGRLGGLRESDTTRPPLRCKWKPKIRGSWQTLKRASPDNKAGGPTSLVFLVAVHCIVHIIQVAKGCIKKNLFSNMFISTQFLNESS